MSVSTIAMIGMGGALGAIARHGANVGAASLFSAGYPLGTLFVNILGSLLMGVLMAMFTHIWQPSQDIKYFLITGFLGAFTTFSAFSLDFVTLYERGDMFAAFAYSIFSVLFSISALAAGMFLVRFMVSS